MFILLVIVQYLIQAVVDVADKFLISTRKIEPISYTFWSVVTGVFIVAAWPWVYQSVPLKVIFLSLLCGAFFSLVLYVFFKALSWSEVSRVVPFVFGLVPLFDIIIAVTTKRNILSLNEVAAMALLIPGALLISYRRKNYSHKHVVIKIASAFLFSLYFAFWQYTSQLASPVNSLMWNRIGAAGILLILLIVPWYRKKILTETHTHRKTRTPLLFLGKQLVGGANFYFLSYLYFVGKISVVSALQGFRYVFLFAIMWFISRHRKHILEEVIDSHSLKTKVAALGLIALGTVFLFAT